MNRLKIFILLIFFSVPNFVSAQSDGMSNGKEHHRIWRKWRKNKQSYNPYLSKRKRNKPSAILARENKKAARKQARIARKQKRKRGIKGVPPK